MDEETYKAPMHKDLVDLKIWVHEWSGLLKEGRRVHLKPEGEDLDDEKVDEIMRLKRINDPYPKRLAAILGDKPVEGLPFAWNIKHYGDLTLYPTESKTGLPLDCHGCSIISSLIWPGWHMAIYVFLSFCIYTNPL